MIAKPKKLKDIAPDIASLTESEEEDVINLITFFYDEYVKKYLMNFENAFLQIEHLGVFNFRYPYYNTTMKDLYKLKKYYTSQIDKEKLREKKTNSVYVNIWENGLIRVNAAIQKLHLLRSRIEEQKIIKNQLYTEKIKTYESERHLEK